MHSVCYLAVEADDAAGAYAAADEFLSTYDTGEVFDYYTIGGRWSGAFAGEDAVCAGENRRVFTDAVERGRRWLERSYHDARQHLSGPDPRQPVQDYGGDDDDGSRYDAIVERFWTMYQADAARFAALLGGRVMPDDGDELLAYRLRRVANFLDGTFSTDCSFYDAVKRTGREGGVIERVEATPERQWLVVCDLHS
jgi:hypothetical protein